MFLLNKPTLMNQYILFHNVNKLTSISLQTNTAFGKEYLDDSVSRPSSFCLPKNCVGKYNDAVRKDT